MDVTNLFLGTGVGRKSSYSIVEQGRIGLIVSAKPQDRRTLIEEAAGITKFKAKKAAAERKMEYTQQNLLRVGDVDRRASKHACFTQAPGAKGRALQAVPRGDPRARAVGGGHRWLELTSAHRVLRARLTEVERARGRGRARRAARARGRARGRARSSLQGTEGELSTRRKAAPTKPTTPCACSRARSQHHQQQRDALREREASAERELERLLGAARGAVERRRARSACGWRACAKPSRSRRTCWRARAKSWIDAARPPRKPRARCSPRASVAPKPTSASRAPMPCCRASSSVATTSARASSASQGERAELSDARSRASAEGEELRARLDGSARRQRHDRRAARSARARACASCARRSCSSDESVEQLRSQLAQKRSRLHSLEEIQQRFEGVGAGVRARDDGLVHGERWRPQARARPGGRSLRVPARTHRALAAALGEQAAVRGGRRPGDRRRRRALPERGQARPCDTDPERAGTKAHSTGASASPEARCPPMPA